MLFFKSKEEKEYLKKLAEEEKELEREIDAEIPKEKVKLVDIIFDEDEEEKELMEYMTDAEKEELEHYKKENKRLIIISGSILSGIVVVLFIFLFFFSEAIKSDLLKTTLPIMEDYYQKRYNTKLNYFDINYLCKTVDNKEKCSNIAHLTTKENRHIMAIDNQTLGDDIKSEEMTNEYNDYMHNHLAELDIIGNNAILSYQDYYLDYNIHADYIRALPANQNLNDLINSKKLTITDVIIYQGTYNYNYVKNYLNNFSDDSVIYLIGTKNGIPSSLQIVSANYHYEFNITATLELDKKITYYELDRLKNNISSLSVKHINGNDIKTLNNYSITNAYGFQFETQRSYNRDENLPTYFFVRLDDATFSESNIYEFSINNYGSTYDELKSDDYIPVITYRLGTSTYIISNSNIGIGTIKEKEGFLCKIGLC